MKMHTSKQLTHAARASAFLVTAVTLLATSTAAHADPEPTTPSNRADHARLGVTVGFFTPTGELGIEYTQVLHPNVEVSVGAGVGLVRIGPQLSVMPRLRKSFGPVTLSIGTGLSAGRYNNISPFAEDDAPRIPSLFANAEAGVQITSRRGPFARVFGGAGKVIAHGAYDTRDQAQRRELSEVLPYGGVTVGTAF